MDAFRPYGDGGVRTTFDPPEASLLRSLIEQIVALLAEPDDDRPGDLRADDVYTGFGSDSLPGAATAEPDRKPGEPGIPTDEELEAMLGLGHAYRAPADPALARLLPDAYRDDPDASGEFRKYTEQSLRSAKQESARTVLDTLPADGGPVRLSGDQAQSWLRALNDVRLALGVRLGVTEEFEDEWRQLDPVDPRSTAFEVYAWLGDVQESLVQALS